MQAHAGLTVSDSRMVFAEEKGLCMDYVITLLNLRT